MLCFFLKCEAWSCRCCCMGSVSVSSCKCCMFVSRVHSVLVFNAESSMHELQFVNADLGPYGRGIPKTRSHECFEGSHEGILLLL